MIDTKFKKNRVSWNKGFTMSKETKEKISEGLKGHIAWNKGKKSTKPAWNKGTKGLTKGWIKGTKQSKEHIAKLSLVRKGKTGERAANWQGGKTPISQQIRDSEEYANWRKAVYERDNYTCQKTGEVGGKLVAHHILNFALYKDLRFDLNNGVTLSQKAHKEFHIKYGTRRNNREQLL